MDFHLILKYRDHQNWRTSFSKTIHPEIDQFYAQHLIENNLSETEIKGIQIECEGLKKLENKIIASLNDFLGPLFLKENKIGVYSKTVKQVPHNGKTYYLDISEPEERKILNSYALLQLILEVQKNKGVIIVYPKTYISFRVFSIIRVINREEIKLVPAIITRIEAVEQPGFDVSKALTELEDKQFLKIVGDRIELTEKGKV